MDLHLLTLIRTKGRRPLHPSPLPPAPNTLQTPRECPLPCRTEDCLAALSAPHFLLARGNGLRLWLGGVADRKKTSPGPWFLWAVVLCPRKCVEFLILQEQIVVGLMGRKISFPQKMGPRRGGGGLGEQLGVPKYAQRPALSTWFDGAKRVQPPC